ncbi:integrase core domain-containing protein, partial [Propionibacterium freudenreichii]
YNEEDREQAYYAWIHEYNHHRPHTSLNGLTPSDRVPNLAGKNS